MLHKIVAVVVTVLMRPVLISLVLSLVTVFNIIYKLELFIHKKCVAVVYSINLLKSSTTPIST